MRSYSSVLRVMLSIALTTVITNFAGAQEIAQPRPSDNSKAPSQLSSTCEIQRQKSEIARSGRQLAEVNWSELSNSKLVVLGDQHTSSDTNLMIEIGEKLFRDVERKCVFFEFSSSFSIDDFRNRLVSLGDNETAKYYLRLLSGFQIFGYTPFLVDHSKQGTQKLSLNQRDESMAQTILDLTKGDRAQCDASVLIVGKAHWTPNEPKRTTLREQLDGALSTTSINLMEAQDSDRRSEIWGWKKLCPETSFVPRNPVLFRNNSISEQSIHPNYSDSMKYGHFDYTVLY